MLRTLKTARRLIRRAASFNLPGYAFYRWSRRRRPEVFAARIPGATTVGDCVRSFGYSQAVTRWFMDGGDDSRHVVYPLSAAGVVFDVGGCMGDWSDKIITRYAPSIHIFEPHPRLAEGLARKYASNAKVTVHAVGLSDRDMTAGLTDDGAGSTHCRTTRGVLPIELRDIVGVWRDLKLDRVDVVKINIEGGEYALLRRMIDSGLVRSFDRIVVQFHSFYPNAHRLRRRLRQDLSASHRLGWDYPFVWESWERKP